MRDANKRYSDILAAHMAQKLGKFLILMGVIAFLLGCTLGLSGFGMSMQPDGQVSDCPFMGKVTICNMSPLEHIALLQGMFTSSIQQSPILVLLFLLLAVALMRLIVRALPRDEDVDPHLLSFAHRESKNINPLRLAFARGIIHPKVF